MKGQPMYAKRKYATVEEEKAAFWSLAMPEPMSGCWLWLGGTSSRRRSGRELCYGFWRNEYAHRVAYEFANGVKPGPVVMHSCDNTMCVNPRHLKSGTQAANVRDMANKERGGGKKLSGDDVREVLRCLEQGERQNSIAKRLGVGTSTINRISQAMTWRHITEASR